MMSYPELILRLGTLSFDEIFGRPSMFCKSVEQLVAVVAEQLSSHHAAYLRGFPLDAERFIDFLSLIGDPLSNYASGEDLPAYRLHPCINRVRCESRDGSSLRFHEQGGELIPHSARSWRSDRPRYFSMLMVDPGWTGQPIGCNGESTLVRWRDVLKWLSNQASDEFESSFDLLSRVPLCFQANTVVEEISHLPLLYALPDSSDRFDVGARVKVDLLAKLEKGQEWLPAGYLVALGRLRQAADLAVNRCCYQMEPGDLVLIDNNRFAHGRHSVIQSRRGETDGMLVLNPRELWSVSIG